MHVSQALCRALDKCDLLRLVARNGRATPHQSLFQLFQNQNASTKKKEQNLPAEEDRHDAQRVNPPMHRLKFSHRKIFSPSIRPNKSLAWKKQQTKGIKRSILQAISATAGPFFSLPAWVSRHSLQSRKQCSRQFQWIISPANKEGEQEITKRFPIVSQLKQITSAGYNTNASYLSIPENL